MSQHNTLMEKITGRVKTITFRNAENGYSVLKVIPQVALSGNHQIITVVGSLAGLQPGDQAEFTGQWQQHKKFGRQFNAHFYQMILPTTNKGIENYLTFHIKGVGPVYAKKIVEKFGHQTTKILEQSPEKLATIKGISKNKALQISRQWQKDTAFREQLIKLSSLGITPNLAAKIINKYEDKASQLIKDNPYRLAEDIWGVGFIKADKIAQAMGIKKDSPQRISAAVKYLLSQAAEEGHLYLPQKKLIDQTSQLLEVEPAKVESQLEKQIKLKELIKDKKDSVYLPLYHYAENQIAQMTAANNNSLSPLAAYSRNQLNFTKAFAWVAKKQQFTLNEGQKKAIKTALSHPISILTGGPGTGKSTTLKALVLILSALKRKVRLAAPTGRAAKRMAELTDKNATTIHRLLKIDKTGRAHYNRDNPLPIDFLIIDEASMLDILLAYQVLAALSPTTHLLLVGDDSQLPSVGPGNVLNDLISSKKIPTVRLTQIFRQAEKSAIVKNAHRINSGIFPFFPKHPTDFYFFKEETPEKAADLIVNLVSERIPKNFGLDPRQDIQVLAPMHKTACGVKILNEKLQAKLNPPRGENSQLLFGSRIYRVNDRVMQLTNNYEKEVFNGEIGIIRQIDRSQLTAKVLVEMDGRVISYNIDELNQITHAWAVSVHKSQGSEYPAIVMPVITSHYIMLARNLLYTAVTRARKLVVLVGSKKAIGMAISNNRATRRYTLLAEKLRLIF